MEILLNLPGGQNTLWKIYIKNSQNIQESIYNIINQNKITTCKCGEPLNFLSYKKGYSLFCKTRCSFSKEFSQKKREKTLLKKYGVKNISELGSIKEKISSSNKISMKSESTQLKRRKTLNLLYGSETYNNRDKSNETKIKNNSYESFRKKYKQTLINKELNHINQYEWSKEQKNLLTKNSLEKLHKKHSLFKISEIIGVNKNTISTLFKKYNLEVKIHKTSEQQKEVQEFLNSIGVKYEVNNRSILEGKEIDILCDGFAIEYNGLYYHSNIDKNYHLNKTELCERNGIQLFHIFENEWISKRNIWESIIRSKLGITKRIYARKCEIKEVSSKETKMFLEDNHLQGGLDSSFRYGLYENNELVSIMTFGNKRFGVKNSGEYELYRFCNKNKYNCCWWSF